MLKTNALCPCGSGQTLNECCRPFILGTSVPETPLQLMRSRYTAYTQANISYIMATMRGMAAKNFNQQAAQQWADTVKWGKLDIIKVPTVEDDTGYVEFKAHYNDTQVQIIHETSKFKRIAGRWYYISGHTHHQK